MKALSDPEPGRREKPKCAVLLVEDDEDIQRLLEAVLARHCGSIDVASGGEQAIELLTSGRYELLVLDVMLPKVNGIEVAQFANALPSKPKIIVISAIARYIKDRIPDGAIILQKPFDLRRIEDSLRELAII